MKGMVGGRVRPAEAVTGLAEGDAGPAGERGSVPYRVAGVGTGAGGIWGLVGAAPGTSAPVPTAGQASLTLVDPVPLTGTSGET